MSSTEPPGPDHPTPAEPDPAPARASAPTRRFARFRSGSAGSAGSAGLALRRRWPWLLGGFVMLVLAAVLGGLVTLGIAHHERARAFVSAGHFRPGMSAGPWGPDRAGMPGMPGAAGHRFAHRGQGRPGRWMSGPGDHPGDRPGGASALFGSVGSVNGTSLVVTPDSGQPVTLATTDQTRVAGPQVRTLTDVKAGDRVAVWLGPDHAAVGVRVIPATVRGTVTTLAGTTATVTRPDGLTQQVDTSALPTQPNPGDRVMISGSANAGTLRAQTLRELPKSG